jgi:streptogramin lyase
MKLIYALLLQILLTGFLSADLYTKGSKVTAFKANDQHGNAYEFKADETKFLMISFDMETGKKANGALTTEGATFLSDRKAYYIANVHGMPGIGRFFAMPKMRKYAHRIILGDDENLLKPFPQEAGKVTVIKLQNGVVQSISYWDPTATKPADSLR